MQLTTDTAFVDPDDAARRDVPSQGALRSLQAGLARYERPSVTVRETQ